MNDQLVSTVAAFGVALAIAGLRARARNHVERALTAVPEVLAGYAAARGMTFHPAEGGWDPRAPDEGIPPIVRGETHGTEIELRVGTTAGVISTQITAELPKVPGEMEMEIRPRGRWRRGFLRGAGSTAIATGNKRFDAAFVLRTNDADAARSIIDRRLAQMMGSFAPGFTRLSVRHNRLTLVWPGAERATAVLDAAVQLVGTGCRRRA